MQTLFTRDDFWFHPPTNQRTRFYETRQLGATQSLTPEGFLVCHDVPLARDGVMVYSKNDLPTLEPTQDGVIYIDRDADEVFSPKTISSFEGKAVTINHPPCDVDVNNWDEYAVGHVMNVRRGVGILDNTMVADLFITDVDAIRAIRSGKREVSCGYDADYQQISPGYGKQVSIIGNHVAIVDAGRCGPMCKIGDSKMATAHANSSWLDRARRAFMTRDADEFEKAASEKADDPKGGDDPSADPDKGGGDKPGGKPNPFASKGGGDDPSAGGGASGGGGDPSASGGVHHHIVVNVGAQGGAGADPGAAAIPAAGDLASPAPAGGDATGGAAAGGMGDPSAGGGDPIAVIIDALTKIAARLDILEQKVNAGGGAGGAGGQATSGNGYGGQNDPDDDDGLTQDGRAAMAELTGVKKVDDDSQYSEGLPANPEGGGGCGPGDEPGTKTEDANTKGTKTYDAAAVAAVKEDYFDVVSRAEILVPGIRFPTFDSAEDPKVSAERLCAFRRRTIDAALLIEDSKEAISDFYNGKVPIKSMTCDAITVLFHGASEKMRDKNNASQPDTHKPGKVAIKTAADINKRNREIWGH